MRLLFLDQNPPCSGLLDTMHLLFLEKNHPVRLLNLGFFRNFFGLFQTLNLSHFKKDFWTQKPKNHPVWLIFDVCTPMCKIFATSLQNNNKNYSTLNHYFGKSKP